ncbi:DUF1501 domain-containing protein [Lignipirellula cremea]|uniref:Sulfatase n=1 Tax=Lignipirellula cremea TaxID=2528010 RepID=A0A518DZC1_9BACT|nr:DUF1501 domain-containing protein [Lignipirellula cremea]QDU97151.1 hypothetical protein Pla8534_49960 [Lignipirellula cremea]
MLISRRELLRSQTAGFGLLALSALATRSAQSAEAADAGALRPRDTHFPAKAKRVIFLCMRGGPSHMETFDYKPQLNADHGKPSRTKGQKFFGSQWAFRQHGESGLPISDLYPHTARLADELCVLNGMHCDSPEHAAALTQLHTGSIQFHRPSLGSWVLYGLGSECDNLPGFISIKPPAILGGERNYNSAFLPPVYQGSAIGTMSQPVSKAQIENLRRDDLPPGEQRRQLDLIQSLNRQALAARVEEEQFEGVIESYELAFRMQSALPDAMSFADETEQTLEMYGVGDKKKTDDFGRQCLLARRFIEAGVRFVELTHDNWDHHGGVARLMPARCEQTDQPIAALLTDLRQRGLLEDTLVIWGGEFGRTPDDPRGDGRGHNNKGFTMWLAGGGVRGGTAYGATDEYGYEAVTDRMHIHDLHATLLHLLGLDHKRLTYRYAGRNFRLTDVHGQVALPVIA